MSTCATATYSEAGISAPISTLRCRGARERWRFEDRHAVLGRDFADARGDVIRTLGYDHRRTHALVVVAQRDREVRRVHDDHIGLRHFLHHAAASELLLSCADAAFDFGRAVAFLQLLTDLLATHLQLLRVLPELPGHVHCGDQRE